MQTQSTSLVRYGILVLPAIAVAAIAIVKYHPPRVTVSYAKSYGKEINWNCHLMNPPGIQILDSHRLAVGRLLSRQEKPIAGVGTLSITVATPKPIQYHMANNLGIDVRYRKQVCTVTLGGRSFRIDNAQILRVGNKTVPLGSRKMYLTFSGDSAQISPIPPAWYTSLSPQDLGSSATKLDVTEQDVHSLTDTQFTSDNKTLSGRSLYSTQLSAVDCDVFAIGVMGPRPGPITGRELKDFSHVDLIVDGPGNASITTNSIRENYDKGIAALKVGATDFKIIDHGTKLQTPSGEIPLKGAKKYITVSINKVLKVTSAKPSWYTAFDREPPTPAANIYTISPE